jgi:hypothetical protein
MIEITPFFVRENLPTCSTISPCNEKERLMKWKMWKTLNGGSGILRIVAGLPLQTTNDNFSDNNSYNRGDREPPDEHIVVQTSLDEQQGRADNSLNPETNAPQPADSPPSYDSAINMNSTLASQRSNR